MPNIFPLNTAPTTPAMPDPSTQFIQCRQLNLQKCKIASATFAKELDDVSQNPFINLLQEPYTFRGRVCYMPPRCNIYQGADPRACIVAAGNLHLWEVPSLTTRDRVCCILKLGDDQQLREILFVSLYLDITSPTEDAVGMFEEVMQFANGRQVIFGADTNAHSTLWGSPENNARGDGLEEFLFHSNLEILNIGSIPTFQTS